MQPGIPRYSSAPADLTRWSMTWALLACERLVNEQRVSGSDWD